MSRKILPALMIVGTLSVNADEFIVVGDFPSGKVMHVEQTYKNALIKQEKLKRDLSNNVMIDHIIRTPKIMLMEKKAMSTNAYSTSANSIDLTERYTNTLPNDPFVISQQYLRDYTLHHIEIDGNYYGDLRGVGAIEAWPFDIASDNVKVRVMVIDGGFIANNDVVYNQGINFVHPEQDLLSFPDLNFFDENYLSGEINLCDGNVDNHGLQVSGLIAAIRDNEIGVAGVAKNVELISSRVMNCGVGYLSNIIRSILYGAQITDSFIIDAVIPEINEPVDIINISLVGRTPQCPVQLQAAIDAATEKGIIIVSSAGNTSESASEYYPGNCRNVINVGGTNIVNEQLWSSTNFGEDVDIYAPAVTPALLSGFSADNIETAEGTSNSAPLVTGIIAMVKRNIPTSTYDEINFLITKTANIMTDGNLTVNAPSTLANAINRNNNTAGTIIHGLEEETSCEQASLVTAFNARFNLCNKAKVNFLVDVERNENRVFELISLDDDHVVLTTSSPSTYFDISDIDITAEYGFNVCINGECERSPLNFEIDINTPDICVN